MVRRILYFVVLGLILASTVSCVVVAAGAGAGTAYSVTADTVSDNLPVSKERAVELFTEIINSEGGKLLSVSITEGKVSAKIKNVRVYFKAKLLTINASHITIRARKGLQLLPDKDTAIRLYKKMVRAANG